MRKITFLATLLVASLLANAQLTYGPRLGVNLSTQQWKGVGSENYDLDSKAGILIGIFGNYAIDSKLSVNADLAYSQEGTKESSKLDDGSGKFNLAFIRMPVTVQYKLIDKLYAETGPSVGYLLSAKETWNDEEYTSSEGLRKIDLGWTLGAGYDLSGLLSGLGVDVRYYYGISNGSKRQVNGGDEFKQRSLTIGFRYQLNK